MTELIRIRDELEIMANREAMKLFRLAWRAQEHGCKPETVRAIRKEANELHMMVYPERLLSRRFEHEHKYAFKY